jgi:hypothetical protein
MATLTKLSKPHDLYVEHQAELQSKLAALTAKIESHAQREAADPTNWGFNGDIIHVNQTLDELLEFMKGV